MAFSVALLNQIGSTIFPGRPAIPAAAAGNGEFGSILDSAIQKVNQYQLDANQSIQRFLSGNGEELHNVAMAAQRAEIALDLGVQIRNKVVSAYQEIMKMQL